MPRRMKIELSLYFGLILFIIISRIYIWIQYGLIDNSFLLIMLIIPCFMILSIYHRYYTSENEPGLNLPKYKFPYAVRRRWSWIHAIAGVLYGILMIALIFFRPAESSAVINWILAIIGLLILFVNLKEIYRLSKKEEALK